MGSSLDIFARSDIVLPGHQPAAVEPQRTQKRGSFSERLRAAQERTAALEQANSELRRQLAEQAARFKLQIDALEQRLGLSPAESLPDAPAGEVGDPPASRQRVAPARSSRGDTRERADEDVLVRLFHRAQKDRRTRLRRRLKEHALLTLVVLLAAAVAGTFGWLSWSRYQANSPVDRPIEMRH